LKQIAIIVILAHCGSYVPAEAASIPVRDRLCCRIGNADDQEHNISTFMLEMKETAFICNNATDRSLVLVDELGRATSNEDGVAIAWSTCEYLLKKRAMTFFVTHYPQLARLGEIYPTVTVVHMEASVAGDNAGDISYTHKVKPGACSVSTAYGVELAAACGWQREILENARGYQREVEASLPDDQLCRPPSLEDDPDFQTRAYASLEAICRDLSGVIADENVHSYASVKSDLSRRRGRHLGNDGTEFIDTIDKLLFRYSRTKRWNRRRPMAETEPVSPLPSTTAEGFLPPQEALLPGNFDEKSPGSGRFASEANYAEAAGTDSELSDETSSLSSSESSDNSSTSSASDRSG
jgi:DNA mismatch repair protein MSH4